MEGKGLVKERQAVGGWIPWPSEGGSRWGRKIDGGKRGPTETES